MSFNERIENVPEWKSFNKFIHRGYRVNVLGSDESGKAKAGTQGAVLEGLRGFVASLTRWHNETINMHTAGWPLVAVAVEAAAVALGVASESALPRAQRLLVLAGYAATFGGSLGYHTVNGGCAHRTGFWLAADYAGIVTVIACALWVPLGLAFTTCRPFLASLYQGAVAASAVALLASVIVMRSFHGAHLRLVRAIAFSALALMGLLPQLHHYLTIHTAALATAPVAAAASAHVHSLSLSLYATMATGTLIYATKFPERWFPGHVDFIGASHQLWHLAIIAALLTHYRLVLLAATAWPALPCSQAD
jgi:adiponectin receptor